MTLQQNTDHIQTTHIGSLPRPHFERWAFGIGPLRRDRHGRTDARRGFSDQSGGIALTMSLCLASSIFAIEAGGLILRSKQPRPVPTRRFLSLRWGL